MVSNSREYWKSPLLKLKLPQMPTFKSQTQLSELRLELSCPFFNHRWFQLTQMPHVRTSVPCHYHVTTMSFNRSVQVDWMDESRLNHRKRPIPDPLILPESNRFAIPHTKWSKLNKFILNFHEALPKVRVHWFGFNRHEWFLPQILTS